MDINDISKQHGKSVAFVFKKRGVEAPPTSQNILLQTILHKDDFINDLEAAINADGYDNYEGPPILPAGFFEAVAKRKELLASKDVKTLPTVVVTSKPKANKVANTLRDILGIVGSTFGAYKGAKGNTATPPFVDGHQNEPAQKKKTNYLLIGGIVLIIVLAVAVLSKKK